MGLFIVSYFGLIGYKLSLNKNNQNIQAEIQAVKIQINNLLQGQENGFDQNIALMNLIKEILVGHIYWTNFFEKLEQTTLPFVQFSNLSASSEHNTVMMQGKTINYTILAQQMAVFSQNKDSFSETIFSNISQARQGNISFDLKLVLNNHFLNKKSKKQKE